MSLNTDHLKRCIQTLQSSLNLYQGAAPESIDQEVFRNAVVKGYELAQETSFKLLKKALRDFGYTSKKLDQSVVKELLRLAATHGLMSLEEVERWFTYCDNRNKTAHDYGEGFAKETLVLLPGFIRDVSRLESILHAQFSQADH